ncbi:MAG: ABC transporter permease [Bacteroidetes bacterium]|nr:ABC transporter permease [Bacteroidota bacterium]
MDYRFLIARRYLVSPRSVSLISRITGISVVGITLGVAALIVVLSVLNGFFDFVRNMLVSFDPHIRIVSLEEKGFDSPDSLIALSVTHEQVKSASAYVEGKAMLLHQGAGDVNKVVVVRGVDASFLQNDDGVAESTTLGSFSVEEVDGRPGIVLGRQLGERLLLSPAGGTAEASRVALLSAPAIERMYTRVLSGSPYRQFEVRGLFQLEAVFDESHAFIDLQEGQRLFSMGRKVSGIELRLDDLEQATEVRDWLEDRIDTSRFEVMTWYDLQKPLYDVMKLEKFGASLVLLLIVIVAAFNIVGSLTMIVIEKRRDVGALRAMGVSKKKIREIFLSVGLLIGLVGAGCGVALGLLISLAQKKFAIVPLPDAGSFLISSYPVSINGWDVFLIGSIAMLLCVGAAVYPATRAAAIEPAEAIKMDG